MAGDFQRAASATPIASLDPRTRLLGAFLLSLPVALTQSFTAAAAGLALFAAVLASARPPAGPLVRRWAAVNAFVLFLWLVTPWTTPGEAVWDGFWLAVTWQGLRLSALVTVKVNALFFLFLALVGTLSTSGLARGLQGLKAPDKLVVVALFTARGIEIFLAEYARLRASMRLRGFSMRTDARTYRAVSALVAQLLARAFSRSDALEQAMRLRGFDGRFRLAALPPLGRRDRRALAACCALLALLAALSFGGLP